MILLDVVIQVFIPLLHELIAIMIGQILILRILGPPIIVVAIAVRTIAVAADSTIRSSSCRGI